MKRLATPSQRNLQLDILWQGKETVESKPQMA